ncbi:DUF3208 domain-containing protein [Deinococcus sp. JMULE3]|uniref:DUF3208 domain-containing protein n=1 Tax=Deinococcus sp. JMULE3 TaxID=2518341 RepID=UPI0015759172|nr:DUF3208 domain-containing protein [Deinococcus sp. JMULE3]NTY02185.1 DUF3208 domain-containing protein [Deinococcus sp. JMULE3]
MLWRVSNSESAPGGRAAVRLLQGYVWHPQDAEIDLESYLPHELDLPAPGETADQSGAEQEGAHVLWDSVQPPFAFFENGEPTASQAFYQFTVLRVYEPRPDNDALHADAQAASGMLGPLLEVTPDGVGWQLWEDLRDL